MFMSASAGSAVVVVWCSAAPDRSLAADLGRVGFDGMGLGEVGLGRTSKKDPKMIQNLTH